MMGLDEIKKANDDPKAHAMSELSDGQERRNNSTPNAYWSDVPSEDHGKIPGFDVVSDNDWPGKPQPLQFNPPGPPQDGETVSEVLRGWTAFGKSETRVMPENIAEMQAPSTAPRLNKRGSLPPIYFDAIKISQTLDQIASEASVRHSRLLWAIRDRREAVGAEATARADRYLRDAIKAVHINKDFAIRMHVEELANTIDAIAPPDPKGYVPHMGLHHAMHPVRKIVNAIRDCFKETVA